VKSAIISPARGRRQAGETRQALALALLLDLSLGVESFEPPDAEEAPLLLLLLLPESVGFFFDLAP
jgi:hypothetical protein